MNQLKEENCRSASTASPFWRYTWQLLLVSLLLAPQAFALNIQAQGQGTYDWGSTTAEFSCKYNATQDARANLNRRARQACRPQGFVITGGPTCTATASLTWKGVWPEYTCFAHCTASIRCARFGNADFLTATLSNSEFVARYVQPVLDREYEAIASIRGREHLVQQVAEVPDSGDVDKRPFYAALEAGRIIKVQAPRYDDYIRGVKGHTGREPAPAPIRFVNLGEVRTEKFFRTEHRFDVGHLRVRELLIEATKKDVDISEVAIIFMNGDRISALELEGTLREGQSRRSYLLRRGRISQIIVTAQSANLIGSRGRYSLSVGVRGHRGELE